MLPPPRRGAPHRSAVTQRNKAGFRCFLMLPPPRGAPLVPPGRTRPNDPTRGTRRVGLFSASRPAGTRAGREAEAALRELFPFKPPSPIFGAQPPHSPTLWGTFGPPSYLSFPPGAGGRTEQQRPPGHAARAWCRPAQVRSPSSRPRRPRLRAQGDTKPPPPSWPSPPRHAARAGALVPRSAAITSARAAPRLRVQGHTEPPRAGGPRKQDPSHRRVNRLNPPASQAKRARTAPRTWHVCKMSGASWER